MKLSGGENCPMEAAWVRLIRVQARPVGLGGADRRMDRHWGFEDEQLGNEVQR